MNLSVIVEKKSLKASETVEGSDITKLFSFHDVVECEFVDFKEIISHGHSTGFYEDCYN